MQATLRSCFSLWYTCVWVAAANTISSSFFFSLVLLFHTCFQHVCRTLETGWLNINIAVDLDAIWLVARSVNILYRFSVIWYSFIVLALVFVCENDDDSHVANKCSGSEESTREHIHTCACECAWKTNLFLALTNSQWLYDLISRDFMARIHAQSRRQIDSHEVKSQITDEQLNEVLARQRSDSFLILSTTFFVCFTSAFGVRARTLPRAFRTRCTLVLFCFHHFAPEQRRLFFFSLASHSVLFIPCSALGIRVVGFLRLNGPSECCIKCLRKAKPQSHPDHIFMCC